jgi:hypothetical protein
LRHPIEDDVNASCCLRDGEAGHCGEVLRAIRLDQKAGAKKMTGMLSVVSVLVTAFCLSPVALAQTNAPASSSTKKPTSTKTASHKSSTTASTKAHSTTHAATSKRTKSGASAGHATKSKYVSSRKSGKKRTTARGQQKIEPERAQAIQEALIREHYMSGEPTGTWNQESEEAMRRYQADHGWQSKQVPDSRALINLGLGPSHDHLLNPESAMTMGPSATHAAPVSSSSQMPVSHSADPGTVAPGTAEPGTRMSSTPAMQPDTTPSGSSDHDATGPQ